MGTGIRPVPVNGPALVVPFDRRRSPLVSDPILVLGQREGCAPQPRPCGSGVTSCGEDKPTQGAAGHSHAEATANPTSAALAQLLRRYRLGGSSPPRAPARAAMKKMSCR